MRLHNEIRDTDNSGIKEVESEDSFLVQKWNGLILYSEYKNVILTKQCHRNNALCLCNLYLHMLQKECISGLLAILE
jgi:hypothetical protein